PTGVARMPFASAELDAAGPGMPEAAGGVGSAFGAALAGAAVVEALPASSTRASGPPTVTTAPSFASCSTSTPVVGDGISVFALSVAISTNGSSRSTFCPGFAIHRTTVPSITDSPSCGITTVVIGGGQLALGPERVKLAQRPSAGEDARVRDRLHALGHALGRQPHLMAVRDGGVG